MQEINITALRDKSLRIGTVFTPLHWGEFAARRTGLYRKWLEGATVFDPTMGEGSLLEALIRCGLADGRKIVELPVHNLFGNEMNTVFFQNALEKFRLRYGTDMRRNFSNEDFLKLPQQRYDLIFGNPPWLNFTELPGPYKAQVKQYFFKYELAADRQELLLGGSRIDIAALVIRAAIKDFLSTHGEAVFFMPLSLLLNDGASSSFRTYRVGDTTYALESVCDFSGEDIFGGVSTRYCLAHFARDKKPAYPVPYYSRINGNWNEFAAGPRFRGNDPLCILGKEQYSENQDFSHIILRKESMPRQGVNTCGANHIFFFHRLEAAGNVLVKVSNKQNENVLLPAHFVFPLITAGDFRAARPVPSRWVLLPYNQDGKPLSKDQAASFPELQDYLYLHRETLQNRKGVLLKALLKRGHWWALLGAGKYNFFPYKVVWEAYGRNTFNPRIFPGHWQANQSLQAFIPVRSLMEAKKVLELLSDKKIEDYLLSLRMEGTMNWAQPGRIKRFIQFIEEIPALC